MTVIELTDEQAAAESLSLEAWLQKLAGEDRPAINPHRHISDVIVENMRDVPPEIMARMPKDGASQIITSTAGPKEGHERSVKTHGYVRSHAPRPDSPGGLP